MSNPTALPKTLKNPGSFQISDRTRTLWIACIVIGVITFGLGLKFDPKRAWISFLMNHFYFMCLALGGLFFAALQWLTNAMWSAPIRRMSESFTAYLPVILVTFGILCFGIPELYLWSHAEHVVGDLVLEGKSSYLNPGFFMIRNFIAVGIWIFFAYKLVGNSLKQDHTQDDAKALGLTHQNQVLAPIFMIFFTLTLTMASFDQLMSLDPHWFSTIFGVYCFAGMFYANLASTCLMALYFRSKGQLKPFVKDDHLHDLGKFMFGFTVFWAYIGFSQFMLIWYANLPEETGYFIKRFHGDWSWVATFLLVGKFLLPFLVLLPREAKRSPRILAFVGVFMLVAQWIDVLWMVQPEFYADGPKFGWSEIGVTLGFVGAFGWVVSRFLAKHSLVAIGDPRLAEAVFHHHQ